VERAGLDGSAYGTHSLRRTKATQIYRKTGNVRAVQLLLGHTKLESTVRTSGSRWTMRSRSRSRSTYSREHLRPWRAKPQGAPGYCRCVPLCGHSARPGIEPPATPFQRAAYPTKSKFC
jgi:hypothetical protein